MRPYPPRVRRDLEDVPRGQLSPRAGSMSPSQSATSQCGWGFHTNRSGIDPGDLRFHLQFAEIIGMEGFLIRGWEIIFPGCDGTSALSRGVTLAARWLHEPQPLSNQLVG